VRKDKCIFCQIANGEIPSRTLYEDEAFRVILDISPLTKGHALILPKNHYANIYELPDDLCAGVMKVAKRMCVKMKKKLACDGFNIQSNNEEAAGQTIFHFHMHLIPRYEEDDRERQASVIALAPGNPDEEELNAIFSQISCE